MLTISQVEEKARLDNLKLRLEYLDRDLKLKVISQRDYDKEKALISQELYDLENLNNIGIKEVFDNTMGNPIKAIDNLIEEGRELFK